MYLYVRLKLLRGQAWRFFFHRLFMCDTLSLPHRTGRRRKRGRGMKITLLGAGSTIFARNVLGDVMLTPALRDAELALYDIDAVRLEESRTILEAINRGSNQGRAEIRVYHGPEERREALRGASFIVNAVQIGGYRPATVLDFEIPKKYGLRQTIGDTLGIGGIMRAVRTLPFLRDIVREIEELAPQAWFLNYTNPMSILTGYMQQHTAVHTVG